MNRYKIRGVVDFLKIEAAKLSESFDIVNDVDDLIACFDLIGLLSKEELAVVRRELLDIAEAETFLGRLRMKASV